MRNESMRGPGTQAAWHEFIERQKDRSCNLASVPPSLSSASIITPIVSNPIVRMPCTDVAKQGHADMADRLFDGLLIGFFLCRMRAPCARVSTSQTVVSPSLQTPDSRRMPRGLGHGVFCEFGAFRCLVHFIYFRAHDAVCCQPQTVGRSAEVGRLPADLLFATTFSWWSPLRSRPWQCPR